MFKINDKVVSVKNAGEVFRIVETGLPNSEGVQWIKIKSPKKSRWTLADGFRKYKEPTSVLIPDGVIVAVKPPNMPEFFLLNSHSSLEQVQDFMDVILRMWLSKKEYYGKPKEHLEYKTR